MIKKILYVLAIILLILGSICCLYIGKEVQNGKTSTKHYEV
jgi:hypothetical protein